MLPRERAASVEARSLPKVLPSISNIIEILDRFDTRGSAASYDSLDIVGFYRLDIGDPR